MQKKLINFTTKNELAIYLNVSPRGLRLELDIPYLKDKLEALKVSRRQQYFTIEQLLVIYNHVTFPENIIYPPNLPSEESLKYKKTPLKRYSRKEIADFYKISRRTLSFYMKKHENLIDYAIKSSRNLSINEVKDIFDTLGHPFYEI